MVDLSARLAEEKIEAYRELLEFFQRRFRPPTKQEQFVLLLSLWIRRHVRMPVEEDIKRLSGISLRQIERLFRREIGCSMRTFLMKATGSEGLVQAVQLAGLIWVGFVAAVIGPMYAYQAFSLVFFGITAGYPFVALLLSAAVLSLWR